MKDKYEDPWECEAIWDLTINPFENENSTSIQR